MFYWICRFLSQNSKENTFQFTFPKHILFCLQIKLARAPDTSFCSQSEKTFNVFFIRSFHKLEIGQGKNFSISWYRDFGFLKPCENVSLLVLFVQIPFFSTFQFFMKQFCFVTLPVCSQDLLLLGKLMFSLKSENPVSTMLCQSWISLVSPQRQISKC